MKFSRVTSTTDPPEVTDRPDQDESIPWPQQLYESIWVWAGVAILFWVLSYLVWGFVDLMSIPAG